MKILLCPDKFKECLSAHAVACHLQKGISRILPDADCKLIPMADGGEGTMALLTEALEGRSIEVMVHDPLMRPINASFGISGDGHTAIIEMAAASGFLLLKPEERNPMVTTTYGTGELIRHALDHGCERIIVGIGGSATIDGGVGMAQALGVVFSDKTGQTIVPGEGCGSRISDINMENLDVRVRKSKLIVVCDVSNPLTGSQGAALVYGSQKGATPAMVRKLDRNLRHLAELVQLSLGIEVENMQGAGAAGGLGAGMVAFLGGELLPGFNMISRAVKLEDWISWADLVITGEGSMDEQTTFGKTPWGVATMTAALKKPVVAFTGALSGSTKKLYDSGFTAVVTIADKPMTLQYSLQHAGSLLEDAAERTMRLLMAGTKLKLP
jgi:glycerate kinase